jgi:hypothetical protein
MGWRIERPKCPRPGRVLGLVLLAILSGACGGGRRGGQNGPAADGSSPAIDGAAVDGAASDGGAGDGGARSTIGWPDEFSGTFNFTGGTNRVVVWRVQALSAVVATHVGLVTRNSGVTARFMIYRDNGSDKPGTLVHASSTVTLPLGRQEFALSPSVSLDAGTYWIGLNHASDWHGAADLSQSSAREAIPSSLPLTDPAPTTFPTAAIANASPKTFYLVVTP